MPSRPAILLALLTVIGGAPACDNECRPGSDPPTLRIGTGVAQFEPLDDDAPRMEIVRGPQGGYHVFVGLEATRMNARDLMGAELEGVLEDDVVGGGNPWVPMRCNQRTGTLQSWGHLLIWGPPPEELDGQTVRVEAELWDRDGRRVSSEVEVELFYEGG